MNAFWLKLIAIAAMFINHVTLSGLIGYEDNPTFYLFALVIGKLTFPIMAYLLTEGYHYTKDHKKYAMRLAGFWILSIIPFWLAFEYPKPFTPLDLVNNIMFTLLMGLLLIMITDKAEFESKRTLLVFLFSFLTLFSDWGAIGVLLIYGFHRIKERPQKVVRPIMTIMIPMLLLLALGAFVAITDGEDARHAVYDAVSFAGMLLPIPVLLLYNGDRGYSPAWVKWGFYLFYPAHLLLLAAWG